MRYLIAPLTLTLALALALTLALIAAPAFSQPMLFGEDKRRLRTRTRRGAPAR